MSKVAVVMGSGSDYPVLEPAIKTLKKFGVTAEVSVLSAHRTPDAAAAYARSARDSGISVIICAAGKAAALPGAMAACTTLPVIGVPVKSSALDGLDALLSMVQMPSGVPVATVAIDGAANAALLALSILGVFDPAIAAALAQYRESLAADVVKADAEVKAKAERA